MVWINNGKASRGGGEPVRASRSFSPTSVSPILQAAFPLTLFDEITSSGSSVGSLPISGKTNPTCPSLILLPPFPHLLPQVFPSAPPPAFYAVLRLPFCPCFSSPCAPSEQAVMGVTGSSCGRAKMCFVVSSRVLL